MVAVPATMWTRVRAVIPAGGTLPDDVWRGRHTGILVVLWLHALFIPLFALARGFSPLHALVEGTVVPSAAVLAGSPALSRRARTVVASFGLLSASAVLVHLSGGVIEMHFHFFVMVALVTLYQDWVPFLVAIGYVFIHHGLIGALDATSVFNHFAAPGVGGRRMSARGAEITRQGDVVVARLEGDIDLANTPTVSATVLESVPNDAVGLVVDLGDVRYIDSVGIRMLFTFVRSLHAARQGMAIVVPAGSPVRQLLKVTHLDEATVFRASVDEATAALREGGTPQY